MSKRRRTQGSGVTFVRTDRKRPIDKELFSLVQGVPNTNQVDTDLLTASFPGTITGLRWDVSMVNGAASHDAITWVIIHVPQGDSANAIGTGNGTNIYTPEKNVLALDRDWETRSASPCLLDWY